MKMTKRYQIKGIKIYEKRIKALKEELKRLESQVSEKEALISFYTTQKEELENAETEEK